MPLTIPDPLLLEAGWTEREARIEIACRLYDAGQLTLPLATRWAQVSRAKFEEELLKRQLPLIRPTVDDLRQDLDTLNRLGV
jgi:predicted HTH domain antitoxin